MVDRVVLVGTAEIEEMNFDAIADYWETLDTAYRNDEFYATVPKSERRALDDTYLAARDAYWRAVNESLSDNNSFVEQTRKELKKSTKALKKALDKAKDIKRILEFIKNSVKLMLSLVVAASTL